MASSRFSSRLPKRELPRSAHAAEPPHATAACPAFTGLAECLPAGAPAYPMSHITRSHPKPRSSEHAPAAKLRQRSLKRRQTHDGASLPASRTSLSMS